MKPTDSIQTWSHSTVRSNPFGHMSDQKTCFSLFSLAVLLTLPLLIWNQYLPNDTATFYAPMIREFGAGNYARAFFPLIPPFFVIVGGLFAKLGFPPFFAAKLASSLFFTLTVLPLFGLGKILWGRDTAAGAAVLFSFCHYMLEYSGTGLLDTGKIFFLTMTVYGLIRAWRTWDWFSLWATAVGTAGLALVRGEGIFFSLMAWFSLAVIAICRALTWRQKLRFIPVFLAVAIAVSPWIAYEWQTTGYPVTDSRQITSIKSLLTTIGVHGKRPAADNMSGPSVSASPSSGRGTPVPHVKQNLAELAIEVGKGFYPFYAILALIGIGLRFHRRLWQPEEWFLLGTILCHTAFLIVVLHVISSALVQKRYVIAVLPLLLGWTATGLAGLLAFMGERFAFARQQKIRYGLFAVLGAVLLWNGYSDLHHSAGKRLENKIERDCGHWLATEGRKYIPRDARPLASTPTNYHNGRLPILLTVEPQIPFWAGADRIIPSKRLRYSLAEFLSLCEENSIHFVVWDRKLVERCPELENLEKLPASLAIVYDRWRQEKYATVLLAYRPHTQPAPFLPLKTEGLQ